MAWHHYTKYTILNKNVLYTNDSVEELTIVHLDFTVFINGPLKKIWNKYLAQKANTTVFNCTDYIIINENSKTKRSVSMVQIKNNITKKNKNIYSLAIV